MNTQAPSFPPCEATLAQELQTCRAIATRCCFVVGYARSGTTLLADVLNSSERMLMTSEAHYFVPNNAPRFRDWYNALHAGYGNQVTKSTHAPDFIPQLNHTWWQWLAEAAKYFDMLGDKSALSDYVFSLAPPEEILSFFEARFFNSRYIFTIRQPLQTLASAVITFKRDSAESMRALLTGWLEFVQLWANCVRVLPNTCTILFDKFDAAGIDRLSAFVGLDLSGAKTYTIRPPRFYDISALAGGDVLMPYVDRLEAIFANVIAAAEGSPASLRRGASRTDDPERVGCERAWTLAEQLLVDLRTHGT